ncbi:MAG: zf-HC2 domain-containing protein [bacterium]
MRCEDIRKLLSNYIDEEISRELCQAIDHHLLGCQNCEAFLSTFKVTIKLVRRQRQGSIPEEVHQRLHWFLSQMQRD